MSASSAVCSCCFSLTPGARRPTWASVSHGVVLCYNCSGQHRSYGVHISFVQSLTLDTWEDDWLRLMEVGGNNNARAYFVSHGVNGTGRQRFFSQVARDYAILLREKAGL